jgi:hypothetical protein
MCRVQKSYSLRNPIVYGDAKLSYARRDRFLLSGVKDVSATPSVGFNLLLSVPIELDLPISSE